MDKISGYVIANAQGGYDVVAKTSKTAKPFVIPNIDEDIPKASSTSNADKSESSNGYDQFKDMAETGSVKLPSWMDTKREATRSDEEILKEIEALAKEHAKTGKVSLYDDERYMALRKEYVSVVSPNRASILDKSVQEINGIVNGIYGADSQYAMNEIYRLIDEQRAIKEEREEDKKKNELLDFLMEALKNKGSYNHVSININITEFAKNTTIQCDMYNCWISDGAVTHTDFFDPNAQSNGNEGRFGDSIMSYSGGKLSQALLGPEMIRNNEIFATYQAAYDFACGTYTEPEKSKSSGGLSLISADESKVTEAYNKAYASTYERLKQEAFNSVA